MPSVHSDNDQLETSDDCALERPKTFGLSPRKEGCYVRVPGPNREIVIEVPPSEDPAKIRILVFKASKKPTIVMRADEGCARVSERPVLPDLQLVREKRREFAKRHGGYTRRRERD